VLHALRLRSEILRKLVSLSDHSIGAIVVEHTVEDSSERSLDAVGEVE
jgi:hypothetical protein